MQDQNLWESAKDSSSQTTALADVWPQKGRCCDLLLRTLQYVCCLGFLGSSRRIVFADCMSSPLEVGQSLASIWHKLLTNMSFASSVNNSFSAQVQCFGLILCCSLWFWGLLARQLLWLDHCLSHSSQSSLMLLYFRDIHVFSALLCASLWLFLGRDCFLLCLLSILYTSLLEALGTITTQWQYWQYWWTPKK